MKRGDSMENRKAIYVSGLIFSLAFAIIYYLLFQTFLAQKEMQFTIYYHQIGLYQNGDNAQKAIAQFKELGIEAWIYEIDGMNSVICNISDSQSDVQKTETVLKEKNIPFVDKTIQSQNEAVLDALNEKDYKTALELIKNESKRNEQAGASQGKSAE